MFPLFNDPVDEQRELIPPLSAGATGSNALQVLPISANKWLAVSSLQKSIRRGETELALQATACLLKTDADYLMRRLTIIAYEDVGIANPLLCTTCAIKNRKTVFGTADKEQIAFYLTQELSRSSKSRLATDIYCLTECDPYATQYFNSCLSLSPTTWAKIACDSSLPLTHRMTALSLIAGYSRKGPDGRFQQITKPNRYLIQDICDAFYIPDHLKDAVLHGQGNTEGLNAALLLAYELLSNSALQQISATELDTPYFEGIALAALDQFTRVGKSAMYSFITRTPSIRRLLSNNNVSSLVDVVGIAVFQVEGSLLDSHLDFEQARKVKKEVEDFYLMQAGLTSRTLAQELRNLVTSELGNLNEIRREML